MRGVRCLWLVGLLLVVPSGLWGAGAEDLRTKIDAALSDKQLEQVRMSVRVVDCADGQVLYSYKGDQTLPPASNAKLFVTAAALALLGADYEFQTVIWADGTVADGVLKGNLVLQGAGDPNFSGRFYNGDVNFVPRKWAQELAKAGIKEVTGDLVCDDSLFDRQLVNPFWTERDQQQWYAPQISALSFNDNCLNLYVSPGAKEGDPARLDTEPVTNYVKLINTCKTAASARGNPAIWRTLGTNDVHIAGSVYVKSARGRHWIPIHQPALFLGTVLAEEMGRAGIKLDGSVKLIDRPGVPVPADDKRALVVFRSGLAPTLAVTNKNSQDLGGESLLKLVGARKGRGGSFAAGLEAVGKFLTQEVGVPADGFRLVDGSGLADQNRASAQALTELLRYMQKSPSGRVFLDSLSISGVDGTLSKRLAQAPYRGNIIGKTGRIAGVRTLSGYVRTRSGRLLAFSFLAASVRAEGPVDDAQDSLCRILYQQ